MQRDTLIAKLTEMQQNVEQSADPTTGKRARQVAAHLYRSAQEYRTVCQPGGVTNPSEAAQRVNEGFVPIISQIQGFVAYYWVDAGDGVMISTSVFQDQASAEDIASFFSY
jgi:hypothetical protein